MKHFVALLLILIICGIIIALPLYISVNFVCWVFNWSFHLTLLQAFALSLLASVIHRLLFMHEEDK